MAALCERLSRSVVQRLCGDSLQQGAAWAQRLPCLGDSSSPPDVISVHQRFCGVGSSKNCGAGLKPCDVPPAQTMIPIVSPFVSETAMIIDHAYMG
jgi:hypothetical protein